MNEQELLELFTDLESDRVERKSSITASSKEKIREAICAFANDLPRHDSPGVIFVGVEDSGNCANLEINDQLLLTLAQMKDDGGIIPFPTITVQKRILRGCTVAVVIVEPSLDPPVRYRGNVWVRIGPRRATASRDEERILSEKRRFQDMSFDLRPLENATIADLDSEMFRRTYLPSAVSFETLAENDRPLEHQLLSLRMITTRKPNIPTVLGILTVGKNPREFIYGAYVQFLRINGTELTDPITNQKEINGPLPDLLRLLDDLIEINISTVSSFVGKPIEQKRPDYPLVALQQLIRNAILHRTYESTNTPVRITWFSDRIEIFSPGGLYGQVTIENIKQGVTDYRNPHIAEALKNLGYVQRFGFGIRLAEKALADNGNPPLDFLITTSNVLVIVRR